MSKALTTKSEHYALLADNIALKLNIVRNNALKSIYDPEAVSALDSYHSHLIDARARYLAKQKVSEEELRKYNNAGSDMQGLVERYGQIMKTMDAVAKDIKRLGGQV